MIRYTRVLLPCLIVVSLVIIVLTAWVSDDAFITLRTVDNWRRGYGLTWNVNERVQTYTHPLWMFLLAGLYLIIPSGYLTAIVLSLFISLAVMMNFLHRYKDDPFALIVGWAILTVSKAFVDYSTSGLENPLTHLLVLLFAIEFLKAEFPVSKQKFYILAFLAGLGVLNRMDTLLLFAPALIFIFIFQHLNWRGAGIITAGFLPFVLWGLFSLFYYGFLFPNTAYAKLNAGIPNTALLHQGALYYINSFTLDPITLLTAGSALGLSVVYRSLKGILLASGMGLYLIYILYIGGDFMSGRFFSTPVLMSAILLLQCIKDSSAPRRYLIAGYILLLGFLSVVSTTWRPPPSSDQPDLASNAIELSSGISDERLFYFSSNALINMDSNTMAPNQVWAETGKQYRNQGESVKQVEGAVGMVGYFAGPKVHIVDMWAICDPLLSRLESRELNWRIGHYTRPFIDGYIETLQTGQNQIKDPALAQYYDKLSIIISGDLWSWERLKIIWKMNTGQYDDLIAGYAD